MEVRRLAILAGVVVLLLGGGIWLLFFRGGDDAPTVEAGSRFGQDTGSGSGGTLIDTLAPVLAVRTRSVRSGSDPAAPSADEVGRAPQDAVAGLFMVGFKGTNSEASFFPAVEGAAVRRRAADEHELRQSPEALGAHGRLAALGARRPSTPRRSSRRRRRAASSTRSATSRRPRRSTSATRARARATRRSRAGRQLRALGVGMKLAPNADIAVAGGPGQGRAFSDQEPRVTSAVRASVSAYRQAKVVAAPGPFPGDGAASQDPSEGPAQVGLGIGDLRGADMKPFEAIATGERAVPAIQMSNAIYAAFDGVTPATLLPEAVDELRDRLGFEGAIVSADLVATTATTGGSVAEAAIDALKAGVDLLIVPGGRAQQDEAYRAVVAAVRSRTIDPQRVSDALGHIADLRALTKDSRDPLQPGE